MRPSWSTISAAVASCVAMLALASGCSSSAEPEPMELKGGSGSSGQGQQRSGDDSEDEPGPEAREVEVCGEITVEDVRETLGLDADVTIEDEDISPEASEGMPASFSCKYSWGDDPLTDVVRVVVVPQTGNDDVEQAFTDVMGEDSESYDGVGDVAGFDRNGHFGPKMLAFAAAASNPEGSSTVTVLGYEEASEDDYAALARKLLRSLP